VQPNLICFVTWRLFPEDGPEPSVRQQYCSICVILDFCRDVNEICKLLGVYAAQNGGSVPTFRINLSVPFSRVKQSKKTFWNYHSTLREIPKECQPQCSISPECARNTIKRLQTPQCCSADQCTSEYAEPPPSTVTVLHAITAPATLLLVPQ
jgi:hypothetical protein